MPKRPPLTDEEAHAIGEAYVSSYDSAPTDPHHGGKIWCAKHGSESMKFDSASKLPVCEACDAEQLASFDERARGISLNRMFQERDDCAALAEAMGNKEIAKAIRARRD